MTIYCLFFLLTCHLLLLGCEGRPYSCLSLIYCEGRLLQTIQLSGIYQDSKTFVDMPTKKPEAEVLADFYALPSNATIEQIRNFIFEDFAAPGSDLGFPTPLDWFPSFPLLEKLNNPKLREWVLNIHSRWKGLLRIFDPSKLCPGCVTSFIPLKYSFIIPGGRFREFYYWDSYWILHGLLISNMKETAKGVLLNFLEIIETYGFVPNGSRIYYLNRSQPPMLPQMIWTYIKRTGDMSILEKALPLLDREYLFWMHYRSVEISSSGEARLANKMDSGISSHLQLLGANSTDTQKSWLNLFNVENVVPRPESYLEDYHLGQCFLNEEDTKLFYSEVATAAETGWDFSSRWFRSGYKFQVQNSETQCQKLPGHVGSIRQPIQYDLTKMNVRSLIPPDLNGLLYSNENVLERLHRIKNNGKWNTMSDYYRKARRRRILAMKKVLWDERHLVWSDYNMTAGKLRSTMASENCTPNKSHEDCYHMLETYLSDLAPLWHFNGDPSEERSHEEEEDTEDGGEGQANKEEYRIMKEDIRALNKPLYQSLFSPSFSSIPTAHNGSSILHEERPLWKKLRASIWNYPGGVSTSDVESGQQWDDPNGWPPLQDYITLTLFILSKRARFMEQQTAFNATASQPGQGDTKKMSQIYYELALEIANRWIRSTFCAWKRTGQFFEKYDVKNPGQPGYGGEYETQEGFGWTNAVILMMIERFGDDLILPDNCQLEEGEEEVLTATTNERQSDTEPPQSQSHIKIRMGDIFPHDRMDAFDANSRCFEHHDISLEQPIPIPVHGI